MKTVSLFLAIFALFYIVCATSLYVTQRKFTFLPPPINTQLNQHWKHAETQYELSTGSYIGWELTNKTSTNNATVFYFGGNAENVASQLNNLATLNVKKVIAVNYPGYAGNPGTPTEKAITQFALELFDQQMSVAPTSSIILGRSLGTGVATFIASQRKEVKGIISVTPYDSLTNVSQFHFPWLPMKLLLKDKFESASWAKNTEGKLVMLLAAIDTMVPLSSSKNYYAQWPNAKREVTIPFTTHNSIASHVNYTSIINDGISYILD